jgi:hypothetical protein
MCPARILPCVFPKELEHHRGHGLPGGKGLFFFFFSRNSQRHKLAGSSCHQVTYDFPNSSLPCVIFLAKPVLGDVLDWRSEPCIFEAYGTYLHKMQLVVSVGYTGGLHQS